MREGVAPVCTILAGPNGSGKSTIFNALKPLGEFVNADVVARQIDPSNPEKAALEAGRRVLGRLEELISTQRPFIYETTLSSHQSVDLMRRAREANYEVGLVFVTLWNVELNVGRVAQRVALGGHSIPPDVIRRRYGSIVSRLVQAMRLAHATSVYDNSGAHPRLVLSVAEGEVGQSRLEAIHPSHVHIAEAAAQALGVNAAELLLGSAPPPP